MSDKNNTGNSNTGNRNTGNRNTGNRNTGDRNTGYSNTGNWNTGDRNTGYSNTGNRNTGNWNTGYSNTGNWNTGDSNTGYSNTGNRNTGNWNTGNWNTGDRNTGYFNIDKPDKIRVFGKEINRDIWNNCTKPDFIYFNLTNWIFESSMSDQDKIDNPTFHTTGGYLKEYGYQEAFKKSFEDADQEDRDRVFNLPNFDADIFLEISGIDVRKGIEKEITIEGKTIKISEESFKALKESLNDR